MVRVLITGGAGFVGQHVLNHLSSQPGLELAFTYRNSIQEHSPHIQAFHVDLCAEKPQLEFLATWRPDVVVHCAALGNQTTCEKNPELATQANTTACSILADACKGYGTGYSSGKAPLIIYTSTDMVFDGEKAPYSDESDPNPVNQYGLTKKGGEDAFLAYGNSIILRCALVYGGEGAATRKASPDGGVTNEEGRTPTSFLQWMAPAIAKDYGPSLQLFGDEYRCAVYVVDIARCIATFISQVGHGEWGSPRTAIYCMGGPQSLSRYDMGECILQQLQQFGIPSNRPTSEGWSIDTTAVNHEEGVSDTVLQPRIIAVQQSSVSFAMKRPLDTTMSSRRVFEDTGVTPTSLRDALRELIPSPDCVK